MITKPVKVGKIYDTTYVDEFAYTIDAGNNVMIAEMARKGKQGLKTAVFVKEAINEYLLNKETSQSQAPPFGALKGE